MTTLQWWDEPRVINEIRAQACRDALPWSSTVLADDHLGTDCEAASLRLSRDYGVIPGWVALTAAQHRSHARSAFDAEHERQVAERREMLALASLI